MNRNFFFCFIFFILNGLLQSQDIRLPEEKILGEDLRIEKSDILEKPINHTDIQFPLVPLMPDREDVVLEEKVDLNVVIEPEKSTETSIDKGYIGFTVDTNIDCSMKVCYPILKEGFQGLIDFEVFNNNGYRKNDETSGAKISYFLESLANTFSSKIAAGNMNLPGPKGSLFDLQRDYLSLNSAYSHHWTSGMNLKIGQLFYSIDEVETNYSNIDFSIDFSKLSFNVGLERCDIFNELSTTSLYQGLLWELNGFKAGYNIKKIENYDVKFLPYFEYTPTANIRLEFDSMYRMPNFWEELILSNYKRIDRACLSPEEEYRCRILLDKQEKNYSLQLELAQSYIANGYFWSDVDKDGLFEPVSEEYWQTRFGLNYTQSLFKSLSFFLKGEKDFWNKDVYYYPEASFEVGLIFGQPTSNIKIWASYIGEKLFPDERLDACVVFNTEIRLTKKDNIEWVAGISNIGNKKHSIVPGYPIEDRKFYGSIKFYF